MMRSKEEEGDERGGIGDAKRLVGVKARECEKGFRIGKIGNEWENMKGKEREEGKDYDEILERRNSLRKEQGRDW